MCTACHIYMTYRAIQLECCSSSSCIYTRTVARHTCVIRNQAKHQCASRSDQRRDQSCHLVTLGHVTSLVVQSHVAAAGRRTHCSRASPAHLSVSDDTQLDRFIDRQFPETNRNRDKLHIGQSPRSLFFGSSSSRSTAGDIDLSPAAVSRRWTARESGVFYVFYD